MNAPRTNLTELLSLLEPVCNEGVYVFVSLPHGIDSGHLEPVATIHEREGVTLVVKEEAAIKHRLPALFRAAWITLNVHSDLHAVGLTAAFATALGNANISCNIVAGAYHDHIFVPADLAQQAISVLRGLSSLPPVRKD